MGAMRYGALIMIKLKLFFWNPYQDTATVSWSRWVYPNKG